MRTNREITIDQLYPRPLCGRRAVSEADAKSGVAVFRLGAAAITLIFSFLRFLGFPITSLLAFCHVDSLGVRGPRK
jgi:hypothetical protein